MRHRRFLVAVAVLMLVVASCSGDDGISQEDLDRAVAAAAAASADGFVTLQGELTATQEQLASAMSDLEAAQSEVTSLQGQLGSMAPEIVVQPGELAAAVSATPIPDDGWTNAESIRGGLHLVAELDSSGPDWWDVAEHPRVYFTSESYANDNPALEGVQNFIGWHVIDAYTQEVLATAYYQFEEGDVITRGPHGVGVSPDGKWGYVGWSETTATNNDRRISYVGIINVQTGKLDKILKQDSYFEGGMRSQALHHIQCWTWEDQPLCILQWGFGANGGPHHILDPSDNNRVWKSITYDDVKPMGHPFTTPSPDGQYVYISMGANWIRGNHSPAAAVAKLDLSTGEHVVIEGTGHHPIGITHTQDGKWTYVVDGHGSHVYKIDNETNEVVDSASAGVAGPYGICLNWNEQEIWVVGKGEGSHNRGNVVAMIEAGRFRPSREFNQPLYLGGSASSVDHCALHPDPEVNEIWVSNMNGWETIVVDLNTYSVENHIATPKGGDTHGMAFVWYDNGWDSGVLMGDMGGPKGEAMKQIVRQMVAADATS